MISISLLATRKSYKPKLILIKSTEMIEKQIINTKDAPKPVGAYPHARQVGELLFLSGVGPRQPNTDAIPGVFKK